MDRDRHLDLFLVLNSYLTHIHQKKWRSDPNHNSNNIRIPVKLTRDSQPRVWGNISGLTDKLDEWVCSVQSACYIRYELDATQKGKLGRGGALLNGCFTRDVLRNWMKGGGVREFIWGRGEFCTLCIFQTPPSPPAQVIKMLIIWKISHIFANAPLFFLKLLFKEFIWSS